MKLIMVYDNEIYKNNPWKPDITDINRYNDLV